VGTCGSSRLTSGEGPKIIMAIFVSVGLGDLVVVMEGMVDKVGVAVVGMGMGMGMGVGGSAFLE